MKRFVIWLSIALLLISTPAYATTSADQLGSAERSIADSSASSEILYKIDDNLFVTQADVNGYRESLQYNNAKNRDSIAKDADASSSERQYVFSETQELTDSEILRDLVDDLVVLAEAKKLGVKITDSEANDFLDANLKMVNDVLHNGDEEDRKQAQQVLDTFREFMKGFGLTEAEYRKKIQIPETVKLLTIGAMKTRLLNSVDEDSSMTTEEFEKVYGTYVEGLRAKYPSVK